MKDSKIEWCDHTFNPWENGKRTHERNWKAVRGWNNPLDGVSFTECHRCGHRGLHKWRPVKSAPGVDARIPVCAKCGDLGLSVTRPRVFCASLADWLNPEVPVEWLADLLALIHKTPNLDWLLLTKRPELWFERTRLIYGVAGNTGMNNLWNWVQSWQDGRPPANVWIGATAEDQPSADERIEELLNIPARVRFLSCEPLLGPVDASEYIENLEHDCGCSSCEEGYPCQFGRAKPPGIDWVICGGESGPNARPMHPDWARSLRDQCEGAGVPFFFKQWGEWLPVTEAEFRAAKSGGILDGAYILPVGKHRAGRMLDGREHSAFPEVRP